MVSSWRCRLKSSSRCQGGCHEEAISRHADGGRTSGFAETGIYGQGGREEACTGSHCVAGGSGGGGPGLSDPAIVAALGCGRVTVERVRQHCGFCRKVRFLGKIQKFGVRNSMT